MTITDYADILNIRIIITYYHNQNCRWSAKFEGSEVSKGAMLASIFGTGNTPGKALSDYIDQISGETIVFDAMGGDKRREYKVPLTLTI